MPSDLSRITVLVTKEEKRRIESMAGMVPLSRWIKVMLLGGKMNVAERANVERVIESGNSAIQNSTRTPDASLDGRSTVAHGRDRRARLRGSGTLRQIEDIAHETGRHHGLGTRASVDVLSDREENRPAPATTDDVGASVDQPKRGCCEHGTKRGFHCWKCGGRAKIGGDAEPEDKRSKFKKRK